MPGAPCAALILMACEVLELPFQMCNAVSNSTSVRFQFGFTWPPRANSSAEARQVGAFSGESCSK